MKRWHYKACEPIDGYSPAIHVDIYEGGKLIATGIIATDAEKIVDAHNAGVP